MENALGRGARPIDHPEGDRGLLLLARRNLRALPVGQTMSLPTWGDQWVVRSSACRSAPALR